MEEKRKNKRVPVEAVMMYQIENYPEGSKKEFHKIGTPISVNISIGGLQIAANQRLPIGTLLRIILSITNTQIPIELTAKVAWVHDGLKNELFKIGIEFIDFDDENKKKLIKDYINKQD